MAAQLRAIIFGTLTRAPPLRYAIASSNKLARSLHRSPIYFMPPYQIGFQ
ncbi:MAG: hypothetical protein KME06_11020 [Kastovskya adunca ATA6-11-RM4]|nr:hypothetical protein [Kastovskya adunca ATA6-11-RM4]